MEGKEEELFDKYICYCRAWQAALGKPEMGHGWTLLAELFCRQVNERSTNLSDTDRESLTTFLTESLCNAEEALVKDQKFLANMKKH